MLIRTPFLAIGAVLIASLLGAVAPFLFEHGAKQFRGRISDLLLNPYVILGMATYVTVMVLFTSAFKIGGTVRVLYPVYALTFIWAALIACLRHGDTIQPIHMGGMALLVAGIACMSW